jgi:hypothetical protein
MFSPYFKTAQSIHHSPKKNSPGGLYIKEFFQFAESQRGIARGHKPLPCIP